MKKNMVTNLSKLIDLNLKVNIIVVCLLMLDRFDSNFGLCFSNDCLFGRYYDPPSIYADRVGEIHQLL